MFTKKLVTVATTLALGCGFSFSITPAFADSNEVSTTNTPISSIQNQEQLSFTGYVISVDSHYLVVANTSTKEEALSYQNNWWELASQNKILRVPISSGDNYALGEKLNVFAKAWTYSIPPIAIMPTIEKVVE
ncbi:MULTISPECIES: DUF3221 domain-containing protein [Bacillus]|uniref:DUF3221 domain-containing protein n=3 Tax=Bacillus thuringiensis TaxID=1428 RepID=A0A9X6Q546_BACTU|nr:MULTISPECIES: DUF3221 domain-containing protein [Bacillus]AEA14339.1 hypothetical protein CT43_CH0647 [Bacillus thuringiensis serovar chinensis CT-43]AFV16460.1 hypothetical protein BTB_c07420 [Bacillus thuringiensis Bt407]AGF99366.1 hypothetical protein H175_ch0653 [Bacillus thuringiensis serovar thuringiensis str. IS5056]ARP56113.1 DUF3221 domain-containing protein [Bacillus thuringiensis]AST02919.1 DUF3221 domain-containing protein [Bacillus thuringiensis]